MEEWKNASTSKDQEDIFKSHGIRWSEMWHLPYWDPTHQLVVDTMHCVLEGVAQHHFHVVLGLTDISATSKPVDTWAFTHQFTKVDPKDTSLPRKMTVKEAKTINGIHSLLMAPLAGLDNNGHVIDHMEYNASVQTLSKQLSNRNTNPLKFVVLDVGVMPRDSPRIYKNYWVNSLVSWVSSLTTSYLTAASYAVIL